MTIYRVSNSFEIVALDFSAHLNTEEVQKDLGAKGDSTKVQQVFDETEDFIIEVQLEFTEAPFSGLSSLIIYFS